MSTTCGGKPSERRSNAIAASVDRHHAAGKKAAAVTGDEGSFSHQLGRHQAPARLQRSSVVLRAANDFEERHAGRPGAKSACRSQCRDWRGPRRYPRSEASDVLVAISAIWAATAARRWAMDLVLTASIRRPPRTRLRKTCTAPKESVAVFSINEHQLVETCLQKHAELRPSCEARCGCSYRGSRVDLFPRITSVTADIQPAQDSKADFDVCHSGRARSRPLRRRECCHTFDELDPMRRGVGA